MILCVCGGRDYQDVQKVFSVLDAIHKKREITKIAQGLCPTGADAHAVSWANSRNVACIGFLANWREFGRKAGPMRNQQMVDYGIDGLVAFPGGRGTADMVGRAKAAGVTVMEVSP